MPIGQRNCSFKYDGKPAQKDFEIRQTLLKLSMIYIRDLGE